MVASQMLIMIRKYVDELPCLGPMFPLVYTHCYLEKMKCDLPLIHLRRGMLVPQPELCWMLH